MIQRRDFLKGASAALFAGAWLQAAESQPDLRITRAVSFRLPLQRSKVAGKNSRLDVHGDRAADRMVRIWTNTGLDAVGICRANENAVAEIVGKNPFDFYRESERTMTSPLGAGTMPLWDLAGKVLDRPAYRLLGGAGPERVGVYDGSIYFADLLPEYESRWEDRLREEMDDSIARGHRACKIKIGRGAKWMERGAGDQRDLDVVRVIRKHVGDDFLIGVDANNGYDLAGAKRFLQSAGDLKIAFAEEMFPETIEDCLAFKQFIREGDFGTLVADGETQLNLEVFQPFVDAQAIDVYQGDMNHFGIEGVMQVAGWAAPHGLQVAPHNWGSLVGYYQQIQVGRGIPNFYRAEHDPLSTDVLHAEGYEIRDGMATLSDSPGFGLSINEEAFARDCEIHFDLKA